MKPEIEVKFLNVNHAELREKLKGLGAARRQPMRLMRRKNFDFPDHRLDKTRNGWARVRDEGDKITMSYKQLDNREIDGTKEVNITVDDFTAACNFLEELGLEPTSVQESKRESWTLDDFEIELDEWPWAKPYVEIEGPSKVSLQKLAKQLELDWSEACHGSVEIVYQAEYDVTDEQIDYIPEFSFAKPAPQILADNRR